MRCNLHTASDPARGSDCSPTRSSTRAAGTETSSARRCAVRGMAIVCSHHESAGVNRKRALSSLDEHRQRQAVDSTVHLVWRYSRARLNPDDLRPNPRDQCVLRWDGDRGQLTWFCVPQNVNAPRHDAAGIRELWPQGHVDPAHVPPPHASANVKTHAKTRSRGIRK